MSAITILLVAIVALLAGMEGILDEFQNLLLAVGQFWGKLCSVLHGGLSSW